MASDAPIVTISCGAERVFRIRRWKGDETIDVPVQDGTVLVMPYAVNTRWTHSVPTLRRHEGRRISITVRAFDA
jgi:alkylated DNA repair dioxygenase AlkB